MDVRPGATVVLLGGCGFLGRALVRALDHRGYRIRVATRRPDRHRDLLVLPHLELWEGDVHNDAFVGALLTGATAIVNLVGVLDPRTPREFVRAHEDLPARVARLGAGLRLVHVSVAGASSASPSAYLRSKGRGEERLRAQAPDAVIIRPSVIYGPHDHFVNRFRGLLCGLPWPLPLALPLAESRLAPVHVDDAATGLVSALVRRDARGRTFGFCGPEILTLGEAVGLIAQVLRRDRRIWPLSSRQSLLLARILGHLPGRPFSLDQWRTLKAGAVCGAGPGLSELGVQPRGFHPGLAGLADARC